ncbi:MAG: hypothetical protein U0587_04900 [Candidatus Binatia bacterium]
MRYVTSAWVAITLAVTPLLATAHEAPRARDRQAREIEELRKEVGELREAVRSLQEALRQQQATGVPVATGRSDRERQLEVELRAAMPSPTPDETVARVPVRAPGRTQGASLLNPDISVNADFTFLGTDNNQLDKANEFSLREAEVGLQAPIDPFARADVFLTVDESGDVGIEEGYATFLTLPFNLQARAGKFRLLFGKNNSLHRHALPQTDRPFVEVDNFGDEGFAGTGLEVSYLVPNPWDQYLLLTGEVVNDLTSPSSGDQGSALAQSAPGRSMRDFAYVGHAQTFFDLNPDNNFELGTSVLFNLPRGETQTRIYGVDLTYRWRPLRQAGYRQFLWRSEAYFTDRELRGSDAAGVPPNESNTFNTAGFYTYGEYRLAQRWALGTRVDWTEVPAQRRETEWGVYPYATFAPSEFGYFRLGYQYAVSDQLRDKTSNRVWLQYDFSIGPHGAHPF